MTRRVLFVGGDREAFAQIQGALAKEPYELVQVADETEARRYLDAHKPSVVVVEEQLPAGSGAAFLASVHEQRPSSVRLLILGAGDRSSLIEAVNLAEVYRFLPQPLAPAATARVLRDALTLARVAEAQQAVWLAAKQQQEAIGRLLSPDGGLDEADGLVGAARFAGLKPDTAGALDRIGELPDEHSQRLSTREREIVEALGSGRRVKDIAQDLIISTHTVRNHLKAIYRKLNVRSQFELIGLMARNH